LTANIGLGWKSAAVANTLAYCPKILQHWVMFEKVFFLPFFVEKTFDRKVMTKELKS
jgi:hypothetical protein